MSSPLDELRRATSGVGPAPPAMTDYLGKVRSRAYTVTDADVAQLRDAELSEDVIFEQTVVAAVDEGVRRLDAAVRVIG